MAQVLGLLHTSSAYYKENLDFDTVLTNALNRGPSDISYLQSQENFLYQKFGASSYKGFKENLQNLINSQDKVCIQRFSADNLYDEIRKFGNSKINQSYTEDVTFEIQVGETQISLFESLKLPNYDIQGTTITMTGNLSVLRSVLNKVYGKRFKIGKKTVTEQLESFISENQDLISIVKDGQKVHTLKHKTSLEISNFPWGVKKEHLDAYLNSTDFNLVNGMREQLSRAFSEIKNYIFTELCKGGSNQLLQAANITWNSLLSSSQYDLAITNFFGGNAKGNFASAVIGAMGEFQTALIFNYLALKINSTEFSKIIGNIYQNGEQLRTDVEIFKRIGIQVKNFTSGGFFGQMRYAGTTIHPDKLFSYLPGEKLEFQTFLANYYFNTDIQSQNLNSLKELEHFLGEHLLAETMNLAMDTNISDTISFYFIGGKYLVPGSEIVKWATNKYQDYKSKSTLTRDNTVYITGPKKTYSDLYFKENPEEREKYWEYDQTKSSWDFTNYNLEKFNSINSDISIRTNIELTLDNLSEFQIF